MIFQNQFNNPMCQCVVLEQLTRERTNILRHWLDGTVEGDVCSGSVKIKKQFKRPE